MTTQQTPGQWFALAEKSYAEKHQGCAWCGGSHRVYLTRRDQELSYECSYCDFQTGYDKKEDRFFMIPGEEVIDAPATMHQF